MVEQANNKPMDEGFAAQLRKHYYLERYALIAPQRSKRPRQFGGDIVSEKTQSSHPIEDQQSILELPGDRDDWDVKVVPNAYPAVSADNPNAAGAHEVVLETPKPNTPFGELSVDEITQVLRAYQERARELSKHYGYVSIFKNHGHRAGASLAHTHSQIIATDIIPPAVLTERRAISQYQRSHNTSPLCDIIRWELTQAKRVIAHTRYSTTLCPYASQLPLETWIIPNRQVHSVADLSPEELRSLADHLKGAAKALTGNGIDFNYYLSEGVADEYNHFFLRLIPRITIHGGYEFDTDIYVNPVSPEYSRKWYQKYINI